MYLMPLTGFMLKCKSNIKKNNLYKTKSTLGPTMNQREYQQQDHTQNYVIEYFLNIYIIVVIVRNTCWIMHTFNKETINVWHDVIWCSHPQSQMFDTFKKIINGYVSWMEFEWRCRFFVLQMLQ